MNWSRSVPPRLESGLESRGKGGSSSALDGRCDFVGENGYYVIHFSRISIGSGIGGGSDCDGSCGDDIGVLGDGGVRFSICRYNVFQCPTTCGHQPRAKNPENIWQDVPPPGWPGDFRLANDGRCL